MALGDVIARLAVSLTLETAALERGATLAEKRFEQSRKRFESTGKKLAGIGNTMSLAITAPLVALATSSYQAAQESADALGQVTSTLKSMGDASGRTVEQLQALAGAQMSQSLYDDDEILRKVTANLLTFGNISGTAFDQAQQAAIDLSARLGQDLQSSAIQIGKALNDPVKGLTALSRVGVSFTEQQQAQVKAMVAAGDAAGAQALILGELQKQYGGAAAAARAADPTAESKQAWADFQEIVGALVMEFLPPLTSLLTTVLEGFNSLSPGMQKVIVIGGALFAALGPVLSVFGSLVTVGAPLLSFLTTVAPAISVVSKALLLLALNPAFLALAAVLGGIYLAWRNWDTIGPIVQRVYTQVKTWILDKLGKVLELSLLPIRNVERAFAWLYDKVVGHSWVPDMVTEVGQHMGKLDALMAAPAQKATKKTGDAFRDMASDVRQLLSELFPEVQALMDFRAKKALIDRLPPDLQGEAMARLGRVTAGLDPRGQGYGPGADISSDPLGQDGFDRAAEGWDRYLGKLSDKAKESTVRIAKSFKDMADETLDQLRRLTDAFKGGSFLDKLGAVIGFGLQLGSVGAFGKTIAGNINASKGFAAGTPSAPRGLHWVGERGPELVRFNGGERVFSNRDSMTMADQTVIRVQLSEDLDARIVQGAARVVVEAAPAIVGRSKAETLRTLGRPGLG